MDKRMKKIERRQNRLLKKARGEKIGFVESIPLRIAGRCDGAKGLPKPDADGVWASSVSTKEIHSYKEFCDRAWARVQLDLSEDYSRLEFLSEMMAVLKEQLDTAKKHLDEANTGELVDKERKSGEELLSATQVRNRRAREHHKTLSPFRDTVHSLEVEIRELLQEATVIRSRIIEVTNGTRMICEKAKDHTRQRIDVYWNATLKNHPQKESVPVTPTIRMLPDAEIVNTKAHRRLLEELEDITTHLVPKYNIAMEGEG